MTSERSLVLAEARTWLGTPFHHAARLKGIGVDCAHLLIACYVGCGVVEPIEPEFYSADWFLHQDVELLRGWVERHCVSIDAPIAGDILLFRYGRSESHGAIYLGDDRLIHAFRGHGVVEDECGAGTPLRARFTTAWRPARWAAIAA